MLELGAGTGYWAACLRQRGVAVRAFDKYPPDKRCANMFFCHSFCDVEEGGSEVLDSWPGGSAKLVLLLVWPFNADEHKKRAAAGATPWDAERAGEHSSKCVCGVCGSLTAQASILREGTMVYSEYTLTV